MLKKQGTAFKIVADIFVAYFNYLFWIVNDLSLHWNLQFVLFFPAW